MFTPMTSRHFTERINENGVKYWVLSTHVAPIQQGLYFVNSGFSRDGRFLWFYCAFPPAAGQCLGVIDFLTDDIHVYPETYGHGWLIDEENGNLYWSCAQGLFFRSPHPEDKPVKLAEIAPEAKKYGVRSTGSHITFTPDRKEIFTDLQTERGSLIGTYNLKDGTFTKWYKTEKGVPYNHAQICPTNGDLGMCAHEYSHDPDTGANVPPALVDGVYPRLELIHRDGTREMRKPLNNYATHEWWAADGKSIYYCSKNHIAHDRLGDNEAESVCYIPVEGGNGTWHAHCTRDEKYFVVDGSHPSYGLTWWRGCPSLVRFYNTESKKIIDIVSYNPVVEGWTPEIPSTYHIDPHPRFVCDDKWITFTTTVTGSVTVGVAETAQCMELSK